MKIYYDTEFLEDGAAIDLISIGMVADDGRELYLVNEAVGEDPLHSLICNHEWLMTNVVPHLPMAANRGEPAYYPPKQWNLFPRTSSFTLDAESTAVVSRRFIRNAVREFIQATPDPQLWAWYGAYDHVALCQLFGRMVDLPAGVPMWTNDLKQEAVRLGNPELPEQVGAEHNALADARHVKAMAEALAVVA
jgi:hypothetical protein